MNLVEIRPGVYHDSVSLMRVSQALTGRPGVELAIVAMATALNVELARDAGFDVPEATPATCWWRSGRKSDDGPQRGGLRPGGAAHDPGRVRARRRRPFPRTIRAATRLADPSAVVLVSVPGEHAFTEAMEAVDSGHSVMIFSDNVPVALEVTLKDLAAERGVLVMGPDCGTAIVGRRGPGLRQRGPPRQGRRGRPPPAPAPSSSPHSSTWPGSASATSSAWAAATCPPRWRAARPSRPWRPSRPTRPPS